MTRQASNPFGDSRIQLGTCFYDEYRVTGTLQADLDLMASAGFTVIRVGESVWSTWEPEPNVFNLDWLEPILDGAHQRGMTAILGTPTYAVPAWLSTRHPEIAADTATGRPYPWGARQELDVSHPTFRFHAQRVIRAVLGRYAPHPAVVGIQVDNEPGLHLLHNSHVHYAFQDYLRHRYRDIDSLNQAWGLTFWSHRLRDFSELWTPDGNHSPQYQLEWRRFQAQLVNDYIDWQAGIARELMRPDQFVTTCISYERPAADDRALGIVLDVTSGNPYYKAQDALDAHLEVRREETWWSSGVWGLFAQGDRMYSSRQERFLVTETNAQSIGQSHWQSHPPYPGQLELVALALISRGAAMIEYWQWQTLHYGVETYWGGILPHSGRPGRTYHEISNLGARLNRIGNQLEGYRPDADVALIYSADTKRSFDFYPPLADDSGGPDRQSYSRIFDAFYRGAFDAGCQVRIFHIEQLMSLSPEQLVRDYPVIVAPSLYVASNDQLDALVEYARAGGHLILTMRTGYGDELARARAERAPARLDHDAGLWYDEYTTLDRPLRASAAGEELSLPETAEATGWADDIIVDGAKTLAVYAEGMYDGHPIVTTNKTSQGRITYIGTLPNRPFAAALMKWAAPDPIARGWVRSDSVSITSGTVAGGSRAWLVANWSQTPEVVGIPHDATDEEGRQSHTGLSKLGPWSARFYFSDPSAGQE